MTQVEPDVPTYIRARMKIGTPKDATIAFARAEYGNAFAEQVAASYGKVPSGIRIAHMEAQKLFRKRLKELGVQTIRIPERERHMQDAVQELISHVDDGKRPSARLAAARPGLDARQSKKLAYNVPVKQTAVQAAVDLRPESPFVQKLLRDAGMTDIVVDGHVKLSRLAAVLGKAHRSMEERVQQLEAAVILLAGEAQINRDGGNARGHWHAQALALREQGKTLNQTARLLCKSNGAVKKVWSRKSREATTAI